jgi:hypothetical protein
MSLRLIQYHCGRLLDSMTSNPQAKYHARRITEIARDDIDLAARRAAENTKLWWARLKHRW